MPDYHQGAHKVYDIQYHLVWVTKYRYHLLRGEVAERARAVLCQVCLSGDIQIVKGHISVDHIHMLVSCPLMLCQAKLVQYLKGVTAQGVFNRRQLMFVPEQLKDWMQASRHSALRSH